MPRRQGRRQPGGIAATRLNELAGRGAGAAPGPQPGASSSFSPAVQRPHPVTARNEFSGGSNGPVAGSEVWRGNGPSTPRMLLYYLKLFVATLLFSIAAAIAFPSFTAYMRLAVLPPSMIDVDSIVRLVDNSNHGVHGGLQGGLQWAEAEGASSMALGAANVYVFEHRSDQSHDDTLASGSKALNINLDIGDDPALDFAMPTVVSRKSAHEMGQGDLAFDVGEIAALLAKVQLPAASLAAVAFLRKRARSLNVTVMGEPLVHKSCLAIGKRLLQLAFCEDPTQDQLHDLVAKRWNSCALESNLQQMVDREIVATFHSARFQNCPLCQRSCGPDTIANLRNLIKFELASTEHSVGLETENPNILKTSRSLEVLMLCSMHPRHTCQLGTSFGETVLSSPTATHHRRCAPPQGLRDGMPGVLHQILQVVA
eukprot:INCI13493.26.p1 GENE.INCI13493.26~~INCI13493.26.p1  ORF type:complete len:427 (+),score=52.08 INCI13493.26:380-1660(+)